MNCFPSDEFSMRAPALQKPRDEKIGIEMVVRLDLEYEEPGW